MIAANPMPTSSAMFSSTATEASPGLSAIASQGHSLFSQLRSQFPQGALISELVQIHDGQFVVRAIVQVGTTIVATGMAAAEKIEVAEDRARVRAMEVLGISPSMGKATFEVPARLMSESIISESIISEPIVSEPIQKAESTPIPATPIKSFEPAPLLELDAPLPPVEELVPEPIEPKKTSRKKKEETSAASKATAPSTDLLSFPSLERSEVKAETPSFEIEFGGSDAMDFEAPSFDEPEPIVSEPIDLSDAIAQIGTEIERIGWTKKQGSTYLQQTYGKKTRAELKEDELLEFLHYLKALPSKGHPSLSQIPF